MIGVLCLALLGAVVQSPDRRLELALNTGEQLTYTVKYRGAVVIEPSELGLVLENGVTLGPGAAIQSIDRGSVNETYRVVHGKANPIRDRHNWIRVHLAGRGRKLVVEARAYDDGVAFRYTVPAQPGLSEFRLIDEKTHFRLAKDPVLYALPLKNFQTSYEAEYRTSPLSQFPRETLVALPLLMEVPGVAWAGLTEADLDDYAGLYVERAADGLGSRLSPREDTPALKVIAGLPHSSPWRVLMIAADPCRLVESNIVSNLNPPSALLDTSWIRPGKAAWPWWSGRVVTGVDFTGGVNTATKKYYADFASRAGLEYLLVDLGWYGSGRDPQADITRTIPEIDMPEILRHAASKGVKVWVWLNWRNADSQMDEAFPLYQKWGIAGVKLDYMNRDDQWMVNFYHRVVRKAARHRLMVDLHGAFKPTGMSRTWPNLLSQEGVLGLESVKWDARANPEHDAVLASTRMLAGPMDYTPGGFNNVTRAEFSARRIDPMVLGTRTHQLALYVVFECPFQMVPDHPSAYDNLPEFRFIQDVPVTWDETRVIDGKVGDYITIARRHGREWYLGSITDWSPRVLDIPLRFLDRGEYTAEVYADTEGSPKNVAIETVRVHRSTRLKAHLASGGGYAVRIRP